MDKTATRPEARRKLGRPKKSTHDVAGTMLRAALDLFSAQNYSSVSIKEIGQATGVNTSLIAYYFGSKEELFLKVVELAAAEAFETFESVRAHAGTPMAVISLWIENHATQFHRMQQLLKISIDYADTRNRSPEVDRAIEKFYVKEREVLAQALAEGMAAGDFVQRDIGELIIFISTFLDGALVRQIVMPEQFEPAAAIRNLSRTVMELLQPPALNRRRC